jgi:Carboxypeptidase regulatory-like domain
MRRLQLTLTLLSICAVSTYAQVTTASIKGIVNAFDEQKVEAKIATADIELTNASDGTHLVTKSDANGKYYFGNLRPGGPYKIAITYVGYGSQTMEGVYLPVGNSTILNFELSKENRIVTFDNTNTQVGHDYNTINADKLKYYPTLARDFQDYLRLHPQFNDNAWGGANFRYNNFSLDGTVFSDVMGFTNSLGSVSGEGQTGLAGQNSRTMPFSLEVIQDLQINQTPWDIRLGNFTGASLNAVTKSGTNEWSGSAYSFGRNKSLVGTNLRHLTSYGTEGTIATNDLQTGLSFGGPILKDKMFFYANAEITRNKSGVFDGAGDLEGAIDTATAKAVSNRMLTKYGFDAGSANAKQIDIQSNKFFGRLDYAINAKNKLTVRGLYNSASTDNLARTTSTFKFGSTGFNTSILQYNVAAELKTAFGDNTSKSQVYNNLIVSTSTVEEEREPSAARTTPYISIDNGRINLGTWREASLYTLHQHTHELTDNFIWSKGRNTFTVGTHAEINIINYSFLRDWNSTWEYNTVQDFMSDRPARIRANYMVNRAANNEPNLDANPIGDFTYNQTAVYAQDEISVNRAFRITPGIRFEYNFLGSRPETNAALKNMNDFQVNNPTFTGLKLADVNNSFMSGVQISPRLGFEYVLDERQGMVLKGGTGVFTARIPATWLGMAYASNGKQTYNIDLQPNGQTIPINMNADVFRDSMAKYFSQAALTTHELNLIENTFKLPSVWKTNLNFETKIGSTIKVGLDATFTKTLNDIYWQQLNTRDSATYYATGPNKTPIYPTGVNSRLNPNFTNIYVMRNTSEGYRYNVTFNVAKEFKPMIYGGNKRIAGHLQAAYSYGNSYDINSGTRNSYESNIAYNPNLIPNKTALSSSNFELRHRVTITGQLRADWGERNTTTLTMYYSGRSGTPFTYVYAGNLFNNGSATNLAYVPATRSEIALVDYRNAAGVLVTADQQWTQLEQFINSDAYLKSKRGQYVERNGALSYNRHDLDMKLVHEIKFGKTKKQNIQLTADIFNVLNLVNPNWGTVLFVANTNNYTVPLFYAAKDAAGNAYRGTPTSADYSPNLTFRNPKETDIYTQDDIKASWRIQLGMRYGF